jgi:putative glutamine amidotransferase
MPRRPRIGITTYGRHGDGRLEGRFHLPAKYVDAVRRAGGFPVLLPPGEDDLRDVLALVDALVFTGGPDVEPKRYGGSTHPQVYGVDPERDAQEIALVRAAVEHGIPALGICRGCQVLNVALGGTLIEHLPDVVGESVLHRGPDSPAGPPGGATTGAAATSVYVPHLVHVDPSSRLARILGTSTMSPASSHHQASRSSRVRPTARSRASRSPITRSSSPCSGIPSTPRTRSASNNGSSTLSSRSCANASRARRSVDAALAA